MTTDHGAVLERFVDAINAGVIPDGLITPDFEIVNAESAVTDNVYYGREGGNRWRKDLFEAFKDDARFSLRVDATTPEAAVVRCRIVGEGAASGVPLDFRWMAVLSIRDGQVARAIGFNSREEAYREVGLDPPERSE